MRLLNTRTFDHEEFDDSNIPPYATLSHCWETEEITLQDLLQVPSGRSKGRTRKKGWSKIERCCAQSREDDFEWVWIDTCCIDKSSSAELSESINSMFRWYREAGKCYAYLFDVTGTEKPEDLATEGSEYRRSKWFNRGWTLQELLGPKKLIFFNQDWEEIGTKRELGFLLSEITGIKDWKHYNRASVAQKMSWASKRKTTKVEDRAYSLMGLLDVRMPPIYGEREYAFIRLQLELLKISDDETIFAWQDARDSTRGMLAHSPDAFVHSGDFQPLAFDYDRPVYSMTHKGLRLESHLLPLLPGEEEFPDDIKVFALQGGLREKSGKETRLGVRLKYLQGGLYTRVDSDQLIRLEEPQQAELKKRDSRESDKVTREVFHVKQFTGRYDPFKGPLQFSISTCANIKNGFRVSEKYISSPVRGKWEEISDTKEMQEKLRTGKLPPNGFTAALMFKQTGSRRKHDQRSHRERRNRNDRRLRSDRRGYYSTARHGYFVIVLSMYELGFTPTLLVPKDEKSLKKIIRVWNDDSDYYQAGWQVMMVSGEMVKLAVKDSGSKQLQVDIKLMGSKESDVEMTSESNEEK